MKRNQNTATIVYDLSCLDLLVRIRRLLDFYSLTAVLLNRQFAVIYCRQSRCSFWMRTTCLHHLNYRTLEWMEDYLPSPRPYRVEVLPDGQLRDLR